MPGYSKDFKLNNLITKLTWISGDRDELVVRNATVTPEEARLLLTFLPQREPVGTVDSKPYKIPYEDS